MQEMTEYRLFLARFQCPGVDRRQAGPGGGGRAAMRVLSQARIFWLVFGVQAILLLSRLWKEVSMPLAIESPAFDHGAEIPRQYTCDGDDISPPLRLSGVPAEARSLVLIVDDPDAPDPTAPKTTWVHWLLYNLPAADAELPQALRDGELPDGAQQGINDWNKAGYGGPCPPIGRHRYFHKLYALDTELTGLDNPNKQTLLTAMEGHVIEQTELIGTYHR
jgi:Raf kinase inhibitor-like YbhB/YbcL family protein